MTSQEITLLVTFTLSMIGIVFSVYHFFKNPQIDLDKRQALNEERDKNKATVADQEAVKNKAELLAQQFLSEKEDNNRRFTELGERITESMTLAQNHIHTVDTKVDGLIGSVNAMNLNLTKEITKLATIIDINNKK
jgi:hypothetical protein